MDCIWTGDLRKILHALQFQCIFENIYIWATRVLRPRLALHVEQWLFEFPHPSITHSSSNLTGIDETSQPSILDETSQPSTLNSSPLLPTIDETLQSAEREERQENINLESLSTALEEILSTPPSPSLDMKSHTIRDGLERFSQREYEFAPFLANKNTFLTTKEIISALEHKSDDDQLYCSDNAREELGSNSDSDSDEEDGIANSMFSIREMSNLMGLESRKDIVQVAFALIESGKGYEMYSNWDDDEPLPAITPSVHLENMNDKPLDDITLPAHAVSKASVCDDNSTGHDERGDEFDESDESDESGQTESSEEASRTTSRKSTPSSSPPPAAAPSPSPSPSPIYNGQTRFLSQQQRQAFMNQREARSSTPMSTSEPQPDSSSPHRSRSLPTRQNEAVIADVKEPSSASLAASPPSESGTSSPDSSPQEDTPPLPSVEVEIQPPRLFSFNFSVDPTYHNPFSR